MTNLFNIKRFTKEEDGSLLVFFIISIVTVLGIFALSFDMGRRASTQTDMQSFADNVALAAAGELDGSATAIARARTAATNVVLAANEVLKAGTGGGATTISFDPLTDLVFYEELPDRDTPASFDPANLETTKYTLPAGTTDVADSPNVTYVGVTLDTVDVDWLFAGVVSNNAPDAAVGAVAIAGNAGYTCEIAPLMVCLPPDGSGGVQDLDTGIGIQLQTVGNGAAWNPGQFGYLDVSSIPNSVAGACAGETPESRYQACLLAQGLTGCFADRGVDIQTGQRGGQEPAGFNLPFGIFGQAMNQLTGDPIYSVGPHTVSGQTTNGSCRANGDTPNSTTASPNPLSTMPFPMDTCHPDCTAETGFSRFGDGDWDRSAYVFSNYTVYDTDGTTVIQPGSWFDFHQTDLTRYEYYLLEIERAANGGSMLAPQWPDGRDANENADDAPASTDDLTLYDTWDDFWRDLGQPSDPDFNPIIPDARGVFDDNGLRQCGNGANTLNVTNNAARRVVTIAGINCPTSGDVLNGDEDDVPVAQYYEVFLLQPARDSSGNSETYTGNGNSQQAGNVNPIFEIFVEVIRPVGGEGGGSTTTDTAFQEVVQLYR